MIEAPCSDCANPTKMTPLTLRKGSSVREPGEMLCQGCMASRAKMVRELDTIPNKIDQIKALRMVRGAA
jgi:hypothetical protein